MNYVLLLAGGSGVRMGKTEVPKQFLRIDSKPIIIYTLERIINNSSTDRVVICCNSHYMDYMKDLLKEYNFSDIYVTEGGKTRLWSVVNGINYIHKNWGLKDDDIFLAHDAVRPFVSDRIIAENIEHARETGAATTVMDLIETVVETNLDNNIYKIYPRKNFYTGQSPQTFNIKKFLNHMGKISEEELSNFTDLSEVFVHNNDVVYAVKGDRNNIKITTFTDLALASNIIELEKNVESNI